MTGPSQGNERGPSGAPSTSIQQEDGRWAFSRLEERAPENEEAWERGLLCKRLLRGLEFKFPSLLESS